MPECSSIKYVQFCAEHSNLLLGWAPGLVNITWYKTVQNCTEIQTNQTKTDTSTVHFLGTLDQFSTCIYGAATSTHKAQLFAYFIDHRALPSEEQQPLQCLDLSFSHRMSICNCVFDCAFPPPDSLRFLHSIEFLHSAFHCFHLLGFG